MAVPFAILMLLVMVLATVGLIVLIVVMAVRAGQGAARTSPYDEAGEPFDSVPTALGAARRRATSINALAWVIGGGAALISPLLAVLGSRVDEVGVWVATLFVALAFLAVHAVGEGTWPRPTGTSRRAPLVARSVRQVAASWPRQMAWVWAACVVVVAAVCATLADGSGRGLSVQTPERGYVVSPFPGLPYGVGAVITVTVVLAGAEVVLRQIARRRAVPDVSVADDLAMRQLAARRVAAGIQGVVATVLAAMLVVAGTAMQRLKGRMLDARVAEADGLDRWSQVGSIVTAGALAVVIAALVIAVLGSQRPRRSAEGLPAEASTRAAVV